MCNIAGYVGTRRAAPILIEMMKKQEGFAGGYYTGMATLHEGVIQYEKLTGDVACLCAMTDAERLEGTVGIFHSRSKAGGNDLWAHPFVGRGGHLAYVANGSNGIFRGEPYATERNRIFERLEKEGYHSMTRTIEPMGKYPVASDGSSAHMSEIMAQLIAKQMDGGADASEAMEQAFCTMPGEIVGLSLYDGTPDCIAWSRINMPMMIGYADHGMYLASTALAFPEDVKQIEELPPLSGGQVYRDRYTVQPYIRPPCAVTSITAKLWHKAYEAVYSALSSHPHTLGELIRQAVKPCFDEGECAPADLLTYRILESLQKDGILQTKQSSVPGMRPEMQAPLFWIYII